MAHRSTISFGMIAIIAAVVLTPLCATASEAWPVTESDCVRWAAQKRMFLVREVKVFGMNCGIKIGISSDETEQRRVVKVSIPHAKFQSGEAERDEVVSTLLGGVEFPNVRFVSDPLSESQWSLLKTAKLTKLGGRLFIRNTAFPISINLYYEGSYTFGEVKSSMSSFNVQVPKVGGGAVAKVRNRLGLSFRVRTQTLIGTATSN